MKSRLKQPAELEREQLSKCLKMALAARDMPVSATALQRTFNEQYPELAISVHAARKWVMDESIPAQAQLQALADVLRVSPTLLRFGEEAEASESKSLSVQENMLIQRFRKLSDAPRTNILKLM